MLWVTDLLDGAQHCSLGVQVAKEISIPPCKAFWCEICTQKHPRLPHLRRGCPPPHTHGAIKKNLEITCWKDTVSFNVPTHKAIVTLCLLMQWMDHWIPIASCPFIISGKGRGRDCPHCLLPMIKFDLPQFISLSRPLLEWCHPQDLKWLLLKLLNHPAWKTHILNGE